MKKFSFLLFFVLSFYSYGQQSKIDSLEIIYLKNIRNDTIRYNTIKIILEKSFYVNIDVYGKYLDSLLNLSKKYPKLSYYADYKKFKAILYYKDGDYYNALLLLKEAKKIYENKKKFDDALSIYNNLGIMYDKLNQKDSSIYYYKKILYFKDSLKLKNRIKFYDIQSIACNNISYTYEDQGKIEEAIKYLNKSIEISKKNNLEKNLAQAFYALSTLLSEQKNFEHSKKMLLESISIHEKNEEYYFLGNCYNQMGYIESEMNNKTEVVIDNYLKSLNFYKKSKIFDALPVIYNNLANSYTEINKYKIALKYLDSSNLYFKKYNNIRALQGNFLIRSRIAVENNDYKLSIINLKEAEKYISKNNDEELKDILRNFTNSYERLHDYKNAFKYLKKLDSLKDSILVNSNIKISSDLSVKYETEKKEKENLQLKAENSNKELALLKQTRNSWLLGVGLLASLFGIGTYSYFYRKTKLQKELIEDLQVELHHTVKNNLSFISSFIDITNDDLDDVKTKQKLNELKQRIESINEVHKELYEKKGETHVKMKKYISKITLLINESYKDSKVEIDQNIDESIVLSPNKSFPVGLIINEFLTNSYKYAFKNITNPLIKVNMSILENHYFLELSDNGVGIPMIESSNESFGMNLMRNLTKQLGGSFLINGQNGVRISIKFPKKQ